MIPTSVRSALTRYLYFGLLSVIWVHSQDLPKELPDIQFHLTAHPWQPLGIQRAAYLDVIEGICRVALRHQNPDGAIIDPYLKREHQYSTPYFAFAVGTLINSGRARDLLESGIRAMDHSTDSFAQGSSKIPDAHGEFFIAPLAKAIALYRDHVPAAVFETWQRRLQTPLATVLRDFSGRLNNWRTYAMKGEWFRARAGFVPKNEAHAFIERAWTQQTQRERIVLDKWNLYQDWSSDPQSHAVEAVGRGNLIGLVTEDYDGPSANEILTAVRRGTQTSLLLQDPSGQCPPNGRTDDHIFNDVVYQLTFEAMAEDALQQNNTRLASQYRHAAMLSFQSIQRWRRTDPQWEGSFFITKNYIDPGERVGYQPASQWGNYNGAVMLHLSEAYLARQHEIEEAPAPVEIGGYAFKTDAGFSSFVANAGGMQIFANLRGASETKYHKSWTPLGVVRFGRVNWDSRLGPSDGEHDPEAGKALSFSRGSHESAHEFRAGSGVTFAPTWIERGQWVRMADMHRHYRASVRVDFVHPLLVRFSLTYHYVTGRGGPYFQQDFTVTPDGILTVLTSPSDVSFGVTLPILENDGRPLILDVFDTIASVSYAKSGDSQNFISLDPGPSLHVQPDSILSSYGWLRPVRAISQNKANTVFVYPRSNSNPDAAAVRDTFQIRENGFTSILNRVEGNLYVGRTSAGGEGDRMDIDGNGTNDVIFDRTCHFVIQLNQGHPVSLEADRAVTVKYGDSEISLEPFTPVSFEE